MLEMMLDDVVAVIRATFLNGDWLSLFIAFGSVAIATLVMRRGTQIGSMTLLALTLFALGGYVRGVLSGPVGENVALTGGRLAGQLEASWVSFMGLTAATLLAYFIAFMLLILLLYAAKSLMSRS